MNIKIILWNSYIWTADKDRIICRSSQWTCFNRLKHVQNGWNTFKKPKTKVINYAIQLFQLRLSDKLKLTRQDRKVVCVVSRLSELLVMNLEFPSANNKWAPSDYCHGKKLLVLVMECKKSCSIFFILLSFQLLIYILYTCSTCTQVL